MSIFKYNPNKYSKLDIQKAEEKLEVKEDSLLNLTRLIDEQSNDEPVKTDLYMVEGKNKGIIEKTTEKDLGNISLKAYGVTRSDIDYAIKDGEDNKKFRNIFVTSYNKNLTNSLLKSGFELIEENDDHDIVAKYEEPKQSRRSL